MQLTEAQIMSFMPGNRFDGLLYDPKKSPNVAEQQALCDMALAAKRAEEALRFYADPKIYEMGTDWARDEDGDEFGVDAPSEADQEGGAKARAALAKIEGKP